MMRAILILFGLLCSFNSSGQIMAYVTQLQIPKKGAAFAEVSLIERYRPNPTDSMAVVGLVNIMIPLEVNGQKLIMEHHRFRATPGNLLEVNGHFYIKVYLTYDNTTTDPRDDTIIATLAFEADEELVNRERQYSKEGLSHQKYSAAPTGTATYKTYNLEKIE